MSNAFRTYPSRALVQAGFLPRRGMSSNYVLGENAINATNKTKNSSQLTIQIILNERM